jgi:heterotetrameric sarcosine oxidase gamma subunit
MKPPFKLTPLHEWHRRHGAEMAEVGGWRRVLSYGDSLSELKACQHAVGICDISPLSKIDVQGRHSAEMLEKLCCAQLPERGWCTSAELRSADSARVYAARLTADRFLILGIPESRLQLRDTLTDAADVCTCAHVTDVTSAYAAFRVTGPMSTKLLKKLGPADVDMTRSNRCLQTAIARVWSLVVRHDTANHPSWVLLVSRDYGEYVWECIMSAGHEFGIRSFGITAEKILTRLEAADVAVI